MDVYGHLLEGFAVALQPMNLLYLFIGVVLGTLIGVLPGIGPTTGIALLIPVSYGLNPISAIILMSGVYYGAMYGGSTTAILINTPGEASSVMTAVDGYQMARKGRAGAALAVSALGSFLAGTLGVLALSLLAPPMADFAIRFGPPEYFAVMIFSLSAVVYLAGRSLGRSLVSIVLGLMLATVGTDTQSGVPRFVFGMADLLDGVEFLVVVVGLFAIGEVFTGVEELRKGNLERMSISGPLWLTGSELRRSLAPILRGGLIGFVIGVLPGAGATVAGILSYTVEKMVSRTKHLFGQGAIEGVAGPEASNNACMSGSMVPLLTLGIPGSGTTAVLLGAFLMFGIRPGPFLFTEQPQLVWGVIASMYIGNVMLLILNLPLVGIFVRFLDIPIRVLLPLILAISLAGVYALNTDVTDLYWAIGFGLLGYGMRKLGIPLAPMVLTLVLGRLAEQSFRQTMAMTDGDPTILVARPISLVLLVLAALVIVSPLVAKSLNRARRQVALTAAAEEA